MILANIMQPLINVFNDVITWLHDDLGLTWGLSIVLLTWMSRALVLPFTLKSMHGMREMQALQPQMKELQEKYKDDRERLQRETMALFQEHGVNPLSSCLPILFQLPVFIALYGLLRSHNFGNELEASGDAGWLFIKDLAAHPEGAVAITLVVLSVVSSFALIFFNPSPTSQSNTQKYMIAGLFSLVTVFIIPSSPAGIAVYFIATGIWQMGQQAVIHFVWPLPEPPSPEEVRAAKPPPPPPRKRKRRR